MTAGVLGSKSYYYTPSGYPGWDAKAVIEDTQQSVWSDIGTPGGTYLTDVENAHKRLFDLLEWSVYYFACALLWIAEKGKLDEMDDDSEDRANGNIPEDGLPMYASTGFYSITSSLKDIITSIYGNDQPQSDPTDQANSASLHYATAMMSGAALMVMAPALIAIVSISGISAISKKKSDPPPGLGGEDDSMNTLTSGIADGEFGSHHIPLGSDYAEYSAIVYGDIIGSIWK